MKDNLVQIWPIYDRQLNSFLLEIGSEGLGKRPSFRKVLPILGQDGSAWIRKSQAAGLDVRTGYQGYGDGCRQFQAHQTAQAQKPQQVDNTPQRNSPTPVQHPNITLGPTIKTISSRCPKFDLSESKIQEQKQALRELDDQTHHCPKAENICKASSPLLHKVFQSNCNQDSPHLKKAMSKSPSSSSCETLHPSSLSSQIQEAFNERLTGTNQLVESISSIPPLNRKRSQDTPDQEVDLLHIAKRPCGSMRQSYRPSTPSALQYESRPIISEGTVQSNDGLESCIDHVGVSGSHKPTLGYQSSPSARMQGQSSASVIQSKHPPEQPHRSPLDYLGALEASRRTSGYQSPYLPMNDPQATNIHQQKAFPYGASHPTGGANWSQNSSYNGPSFSSSRISEPANSRLNEPLNAKVPEKEVTEASEGDSWLPKPISPEREMPSEGQRAIWKHIAPWNSSHPSTKVTEPKPVLQTCSGKPSHEASLPLNSGNPGPPDTPIEQTEAPRTLSESHLERIRSLPHPQTYYECTGGMLPNRHPRETGICSNMDFKTRTFIDAHGATFTSSRSGPYRYMKPETRAQELAIIAATYQTIVDFELYIGSSPRQKLHTWESYEFQYRQIQLELMERWMGPPELMPKLR